MSEQSVEPQQQKLVDIEAAQRYHFVVENGIRIFATTSLVDENKPIKSEDLDLIEKFHREVSPANSDHPWRLEKTQRSIEKGEIQDPSTYSNWEIPGGPLEHIHLAQKAANLIATKLSILGVNSVRVQAAAGLHDEGREVTHLFYTTEVIGRALLKRIGIRSDITNIMPTEDIMLTPLNQDMNEAVMNLSAEAVIVRIADEFGKRAPGTNRIYQPEDYDSWDRQKWADSYTDRPLSGRPSDEHWRKKRQLHVDNVPRYFTALDNWLQKKAGITLKDLTSWLDQELSSTLVPLPQK